ncbi:hypothetical protein CLU95_0908 [Variovorax sp. 54]|nr:hypothetical protein CLU95_0908 [Variovorax sp. 54]
MANADPDPSSTITLGSNIAIGTPAALPQITKPLSIASGGFLLASIGNGLFNVAPTSALTLDGSFNNAGPLGVAGGKLVLNGGTVTQTGVITATGGELWVQGGAQLPDCAGKRREPVLQPRFAWPDP